MPSDRILQMIDVMDRAGNLRASGRSTRIVDACIQQLFEKGHVIVWDHHPTDNARRFTFKRVVDRLRNEHGDIFTFDKEKFLIKLKHDGSRPHTIDIEAEEAEGGSITLLENKKAIPESTGHRHDEKSDRDN